MTFCTRHSPSNEAFGKKPRAFAGKQFRVVPEGSGCPAHVCKAFPFLFTASKTLLAEPQGRDAEGCKDTSVAWRGSREMLVKLIGKKKKKPTNNKRKKKIPPENI